MHEKKSSLSDKAKTGMQRGWYITKLFKKEKDEIKRKRLENSLKSCGQKVYMDASTILRYPKNITVGDYVHIQLGCKVFGGGGIGIGKGSVFAHDVLLTL